MVEMWAHTPLTRFARYHEFFTPLRDTSQLFPAAALAWLSDVGRYAWVYGADEFTEIGKGCAFGESVDGEWQDACGFSDFAKLLNDASVSSTGA